jgi:hypothetical protein
MYLGDSARVIQADRAAVKVRDPWRVGMLSMVTLGIYAIVWFYKVNAELHRWGKAGGAPGVAGNPIAATIGYFIPFVNIAVWVWTLIRIRRAQAWVAGQPAMGWGSTFVAAIVGAIPIVGAVLWHEHLQHNINLIWEPPARSGSGAAAPARGADPLPAV